MKRLICFILGHKWRITHVYPPKHHALMHLHPMAGCKAECIRCGEVWDDLPTGIVDAIAGWEV